MKRLLALTLGLLLTAALAQAPSPQALEGLNAYEAMLVANSWKGTDVTSFVTPQAVHFVFADGQEVVISLPDDVMVVSVAPYLVHTHPCITHYMSHCQGELVGVPVQVTVTAEDGTVVLDELMTTLPSGFIDLWLPRHQVLTLRLQVDEYEVSGVVTTFADSYTCITTLQLAKAN
jgi:hypothetical protein